MARTAVVHLVRHANGIEPFAAFMDSYEQRPPGLEHDLVVLLKGFPDTAAQAPYRARAAAHSPLYLEMADIGLDLASYDEAATRLAHERLCFVNSFSTIEAPNWLGLLHAALADGSAGAAGASGSWASQLSWRLFQLCAGGEYARIYEDRRGARTAMHAISGSPPPGAAREWVSTALTTLRRCRGLQRFPAMHLRTNAFLVDRGLFARLRIGRPQTKWEAWALESGRNGITARLTALSRPPVVVDRHGVRRTARDWHAAEVFWQGAQRDLLVADNQTRLYERASPYERELLSRYAWGVHARPTNGP